MYNADPCGTQASRITALQTIRTGWVERLSEKQAVGNRIKDQSASADFAENKHLRVRGINVAGEGICCSCLEVCVAALLPWCKRPGVMSPNLLCSPTMSTKGHRAFQTRIPRFHSPVCRADESSPRRAGRAGCHGLQVGADRGKEAILLPGGPTVLCDQTAHQLSLQGRVSYMETRHLYFLNFSFMRKSSDVRK